ncbi:cytochrome c oxidase accessory protein CcoG [Terricaulis sp.]|uniref:cytochrome c oxidase accessory protein CcoG n=1 Tax=Terricaulis sp. TaxID=2768686 RepID=UPI003784F3F0
MTVHTLIPKRDDDEHRIEATAVNSKAARALYKKREQIYPKLVQGNFRSLKWAAMVVLLGIYYITPWLRWDRGIGRPDQAVLVDFEGRRFFFFFIELWPQEVYYITGLLILAAIGIFLASSLFGRVWCGYACPQTVWTDLYIYVERLIEGDRNARMRLDKEKLSFSKAGKKISKHAIWILIAAATGGAWVFYFADAPTLFTNIFTGQASTAVYLFIGILTFTTYALAGTMREQVCTYMCPWPRIQAAMTDRDALSVTYRADRGEPRAPHKKGASWEGRGDCIDCNACVAACPQGIDIRDGDQLECINCALCIDACDDIMKKVGRPTGLIAYDTHLNVERRERGEKGRIRLLRPRTVLYGAMMVLVAAIMLYGLMNRSTLSLNVIRDRSPPYVRLSSGEIRNDYSMKLINMAPRPRRVAIEVSGLDGATLSAADHELDAQGRVLAEVASDSVANVRLHLISPAGVSAGSHSIRFRVVDLEGDETGDSASAFLAGDGR